MKKGERTTVLHNILKLVKARKGKPGIIHCCMPKTWRRWPRRCQRRASGLWRTPPGWNPRDRIRIHERFRDNQVDALVATIAFGMGIDKGNIRYVIHRDMPRSIESLRSADPARGPRRRG